MNSLVKNTKRQVRESFDLGRACLLPYTIRRHQSAGETGLSRIVVILSYPRSGTTMFGSIIEKFSGRGVKYYGELFGAYSSSREIRNITVEYPLFGLRYLQIFLRQRKSGSQHPFAFEEAGVDINRVFRAMAQTPGIHVVKIFPRHVRWDTLEEVFRTIRPHVVFIRRNHRERYVSLERAKASGKWARQGYGEQTVEINEAELTQFQVATERWYREAKNTVCKLNLDCDDVDYRELLDPMAIRELMSHVTQIPADLFGSDELRPSTTKQGRDEPQESFQFAIHPCCHEDGSDA